MQNRTGFEIATSGLQENFIADTQSEKALSKHRNFLFCAAKKNP